MKTTSSAAGASGPAYFDGRGRGAGAADQSLFYAALLGLSLGLFYDILRALRLVLGAGRLLTGALDLVFCFVSAAGFFAVTWPFARGRSAPMGSRAQGWAPCSILWVLLLFCCRYWLLQPSLSTVFRAEYRLFSKKGGQKGKNPNNLLTFL